MLYVHAEFLLECLPKEFLELLSVKVLLLREGHLPFHRFENVHLYPVLIVVAHGLFHDVVRLHRWLCKGAPVLRVPAVHAHHLAGHLLELRYRVRLVGQHLAPLATPFSAALHPRYDMNIPVAGV